MNNQIIFKEKTTINENYPGNWPDNQYRYGYSKRNSAD